MAEAAPTPSPSPSPTPAPPPEPTPSPAPDPGPTPSPAPSPTPAPDPAPTPAAADSWKDRRIAELTAKLNEERRSKAVAPAPSPSPAPSPGESEAEIELRAAAKAEQIAAQAEWNRACNAVAAEGAKTFTDFGDRLKACQGVINGQDQAEVAQFNETLAAAIETGKAHHLIHQLGANPGELRRLLTLSPIKRAVELAGMAAKITAASGDPEPSGAPKPITPLGSSGAHYEGIKPDDPNRGMTLPKGQWYAEREKQAAARGIQ